MAKPIRWSIEARQKRQDILQHYRRKTGSTQYPKKFSKLFADTTKLLSVNNFLGKPSDFDAEIRVLIVSHFSIFYTQTKKLIIIIGLWDNQQNPDDLMENLAY